VLLLLLLVPRYENTERRKAKVEALGLRYMGMGVSGGEEGARRGASHTCYLLYYVVLLCYNGIAWLTVTTRTTPALDACICTGGRFYHYFTH
jgi:hypothetical protein